MFNYERARFVVCISLSTRVHFLVQSICRGISTGDLGGIGVQISGGDPHDIICEDILEGAGNGCFLLSFSMYDLSSSLLSFLVYDLRCNSLQCLRFIRARVFALRKQTFSNLQTREHFSWSYQHSRECWHETASAFFVCVTESSGCPGNVRACVNLCVLALNCFFVCVFVLLCDCATMRICSYAKNLQHFRAQLSGGSAALNGTIAVNDVLLSVDGHAVHGMSVEAVRGVIVGPAGSPVTIEARHMADVQPYTVT